MSFFTTTSSGTPQNHQNHPSASPLILSAPGSTRTCLLCTSPLPYPPNTPIGVLNSPYASSLCRLLSLPESENSPLFQHGLYCSNCFQVINDIHHKLNNLLTLWASVNVTRNFVKQMILSQQQQHQQQQQQNSRHHGHAHAHEINHVGLARVKIANSLQHQRWREQQHQHQHEFVLDEIASFLSPTTTVGSSGDSSTATYELHHPVNLNLIDDHHNSSSSSASQQHVTCYNLTTSSSGAVGSSGAGGGTTHEQILGLPSNTTNASNPNVVNAKGRGGRGKGKKNATGAGATNTQNPTNAQAPGGRKRGNANVAPPEPKEPKKPKGPPKPVAKKFKCHLCGEEFYQRSSLAIHDRLHTQRTTLLHTCRHCGANLTNKLQIDSHNCIQMRELPTARLPREPPAPPQESYEIQEAHKLNSDEALGIGPTDTLCAHCGKDLKSQLKLKAHLIMTHNLGAKPYKCTECTKEFLYSKNLAGHAKGHRRRGGRGRKAKNTPVLVKCEICDKGFKTKAAKMRHFRSHQEVPALTTPCPHCSKEFKSKDKLSRHIELHRPKKGNGTIPQFLDNSGEVETLDVKPVILGDGSLGVESSSLRSGGSGGRKKKQIQRQQQQHRRVFRRFTPFSRPRNLQKLYLCFICNEEFGEKLYLKRHMLKHNDQSNHNDSLEQSLIIHNDNNVDEVEENLD